MTKPFTKIAVIAFGLIGALHAVRVFFGWEAEIAHFAIPLWPSILAVLVSGLLSFMLWKENR